MFQSQIYVCSFDEKRRTNGGFYEKRVEKTWSASADQCSCGSNGDKESEGDADTFKIGGMGPLTGGNASYGTSVKNGAQIAVDEINANGGVNGMKLELLFEDDESKVDTALKAYNLLMDQGIQAFLGSTTSDPTIALTERTHEDNILQITPSGSAQDCTKYDNCFRICFTDPLQGITMADYAVDVMGAKKLAVIYDVANDYSAGMAAAFVEEAEKKGAEIVANESFTSGDVDFNTQLTKVKASGAEVLFLPTYYSEVAYIVIQADKLGMDIPLIGGDGWDGILDQLTEAQYSIVEGATFLTPFAANEQTDLVQNFVTKYEEAYGATPDQFAADAYDGIYVIKAALEKAGSTDSDKLIAAMTEISVNGLTGSMTFDASGEPHKGAKVVQIVNGEYQIKNADE